MFECLVKSFFVFFLIFRIGSEVIAKQGWHYLVQDKVCMNDYGQSEHFCQTIHEAKENITDIPIRDSILAVSAKFNQYYFLTDFVPQFIWTLFVGSFLDKNVNATRWIFYLNVLGDSLQCVTHLINEYFFKLDKNYILISAFMTVISGGSPTLFTLSYRFAGVTALKKNRNNRLMLCQFGIVAGAALGSLSSGQLLHSNNLSEPHYGIRTYYMVFGTSLLLNLLSIPFLLSSLRRGNRMLVLVKQEEAEEKARNDGISGEISQQANKSIVEEDENIQFKKGFFSELFDKDNIKSMYKCLRTPRPDRINFSIYSIYLSYFLLYFVYIGTESVELQYYEKLYNWSAKQYSTVIAIFRATITVVVAISVVIFVQKLKVDDSKLITVVTKIATCAYLVVGIFLRDYVYYIAMPFMGIGALGFICLRNKLSSLVKTDEMGRFFAMVELIMSLIPLFSSIVFANIFAATVSFLPGSVFLFTALLYFSIFVVSLVEQWWCGRGFWSGRRLQNISETSA